ncbi:MAG TPA: sigma-70 factor domain-containing protein, partial [Polyangiaceae bacterium]|nr:sigma-70 factor domain-containing protein [Polyangiaceae bacterium]
MDPASRETPVPPKPKKSPADPKTAAEPKKKGRAAAASSDGAGIPAPKSDAKPKKAAASKASAQPKNGRPKKVAGASEDPGPLTIRGARGQAARDSDAPPDSSAHGDDGDHESEHEDREDEVEGEIVDTVAEVVDEDGVDEAEIAPESLPAPDSSAALSRTDPLQAYLREVQRHKLLTPEEEQRLTRHYVETQDVGTAARLV